jgi:hypothetical protein
MDRKYPHHNAKKKSNEKKKHNNRNLGTRLKPIQNEMRIKSSLCFYFQIIKSKKQSSLVKTKYGTLKLEKDCWGML